MNNYFQDTIRRRWAVSTILASCTNIVTYTILNSATIKLDKMLSYRRETALQGALQFSL